MSRNKILFAVLLGFFSYKSAIYADGVGIPGANPQVQQNTIRLSELNKEQLQWLLLNEIAKSQDSQSRNQAVVKNVDAAPIVDMWKIAKGIPYLITYYYSNLIASKFIKNSLSLFICASVLNSIMIASISAIYKRNHETIKPIEGRIKKALTSVGVMLGIM